MENNSEQLLNNLIDLINELIKKINHQNKQIAELQNAIKADSVFINKSTAKEFLDVIERFKLLLLSINPTSDLPESLKRISDQLKNQYNDEDINF